MTSQCPTCRSNFSMPDLLDHTLPTKTQLAHKHQKWKQFKTHKKEPNEEEANSQDNAE